MRTKQKILPGQSKPVCPRCGYALVPVHAVERYRRRVLYHTCPEPYCDHVQQDFAIGKSIDAGHDVLTPAS